MRKEGSLAAPARHPIDWKSVTFYDEDDLFSELERVYDICHGCRRCVNLCNAFPTLFDLIDTASTMEIDSVEKKDYWKVVEHCYLCDLCYMTKCPYVPPHEWNVDFPHLMLRAKAVHHKKGRSKLRDKLLTSTDQVGSLARIPVVANTVNRLNNNALARKALEKVAGISAKAVLPKLHSDSLYKRYQDKKAGPTAPIKTATTNGKLAIFVSCYGNYYMPDQVEDLIAVLTHNDIKVRLVEQEKCCGMPKLELGDLETVEKLKQSNIARLADLVAAGWDLTAPIPSCVLMFKQELPLLFAENAAVKSVQQAFFDPFEYLFLRHKDRLFNTEFQNQLGMIAYHASCHQRVQNMGAKTKAILQLVQNTKITVIERCSGHNGTYALKREYHEIANRICRPIRNKIIEKEYDHYLSDCPMAGQHIENGLVPAAPAKSAFSLLRHAYGI